MGEFGDKFRKAREKKELSLDDVSNVTKISARMLQAIEEEHFDQLPGGVFNKGFIRAYSKHLGLNDEEAVNDYLACLRQAQIDAHEVWEPERPRPIPPKPQPPAPQTLASQTLASQTLKSRPIEAKVAPVKPQPPVEVEELPDLHLPRAEDVRPRRKDFGDKSTFEIPGGILAVAVVIVILVGILWMRHSRSGNTAITSSSSVNTVQASTAEKAVPVKAAPEKPALEKTVPQKVAQNPAAQPVAMAAPATRPSSAPPANTSTAPAASTASPQPPPTHPATTPASTADSTKVKDKSNDADNSDVTVRTVPKSGAKTPAAPTLKLVISAKETSWISVLADGQLVSQETLIAPAHASVHATREIVARVGNAAGVTFLWNGHEIPADGAEAEVKTFVFDSSGMHAVPTPQAP